jgi:hypothetical protein
MDLVGRITVPLSQPELSPTDMKHSFAVQPTRGSRSKREWQGDFLCHCVRCKWTFQVNPDHGSIIAFNNVNEPLAGAEASKRVASFPEGPCPAFADFPGYQEAREAARPKPLREKLHPILHLLGLEWAA